MGVKKLSSKELLEIEERVNALIREGRAMTPRLVEKDDPIVAAVSVCNANQGRVELLPTDHTFCTFVVCQFPTLLSQARSRGVPDDVEGPIRLVEIEGLEVNTCCGTHVSNLSVGYRRGPEYSLCI